MKTKSPSKTALKLLKKIKSCKQPPIASQFKWVSKQRINVLVRQLEEHGLIRRVPEMLEGSSICVKRLVVTSMGRAL